MKNFWDGFEKKAISEKYVMRAIANRVMKHKTPKEALNKTIANLKSKGAALSPEQSGLIHNLKNVTNKEKNWENAKKIVENPSEGSNKRLPWFKYRNTTGVKTTKGETLTPAQFIPKAK